MSETYAYVIVPKDEERPLWGLGKYVLRSLLQAGGTELYDWDGMKRLSGPFKRGSVFVFHEGAAGGYIQECREKLMQLLENVPVRFLIHFGELDLDKNFRTANDIRSALISRSMNLNSDSVFPFTGKGKDQYTWSKELWEIQQGVEQSRLDISTLVDRLQRIWKIAYDEFKIRQQRSMLESLFPLYLTLGGDHPAEDKTAVLRVTRQRINRLELPQLPNGLGQKELNREEVEGFLKWYQEISEDLTKALGLAPHHSPFQVRRVT